MTFPEALSAAFRDNDRITRAAWNNRSIYIVVEDGFLCIRGNPNDGMAHQWIISEQDYFASDWEVVTDA